MNKRVLKRVCQFLQCQKDNEAHFATFWDKTKDIYPEDQSKTKVKKWLQEHSERFEIIAGKDGNPFGKIRLKTTGRTKDSDGPFTTREEDEQITSRLIETIDKQDGEVLFTVLCAQKSTLFPRQLLDKKYIKKWLIDHNNYFEVLTDVNGGIHSVRVTEEARHRHRGPEVCHKPKPQKWQEVRSVDRVQETSTTLKKVTRFIETNGGSVALCLLVQQKGILPAGVSGNDSVKRFLANFPGQFQLVNTLMQGEMVTLIKSQGSNTKSKKIPSSLQSCDPDIHVQTTQHKGKKACEKKAGALDQVLSFICERGGTVPFAEVLMQASELIDESIDSDDALFFWLSSNASYFEILPSPSGTPYGQVKVKLNIKPRFCHDYVSEKKCSKENCVYLHICKAFVCGVQHCQNTCNRSHDIRSKHNEAIFSQSMVLQNCTDQVVCTVLLKSCFPRVCTNYNKNKTGVCPRGEKCNFLHICGDFVLNQCLGCSLSHNIVDGLHNIELLKKYSLLPSKKMSVEMVKTNIAYVQMPKQNDSMPSKDSSEKLTKKNKKSRSRGGKRGKKTTRSSDNTCDFQSDTTSSDEEVPTSRVQQGFSLENHLNTSLSLDQKVESWISGASGYPPEVYQPTRERSQSISSAEESVQSSTVSSQTSLQLTQTEKKVFMRICTKHDGSALFHQVSKDNDLFPSDFDVRRWFEDHSKVFVLLSNGRGKIERVNAFSRTCRLCLNYPSKRGCSKQDCHYIHICRNFVEGCCPNGGDCDLNHDFQGNHNKQLAKHFHLDELTDAQLCKLVQLSTPSICRFYNKGHCNRGVNCPNIHICEKFAKRKCKSGEDCRFGHLKALETGHAKKILKQYQMDKQKPSYTFKMLFVFNEKRTHEAKHDSKGETKVQKDCPKICSQFLAGQCQDGKKCKFLHHCMPYVWQFKLISSPSDNWCNFKENDSENMEKLFCDVNCAAAELSMTTKVTKQSSTPHCSVRLNFQSMSGSIQLPSDDSTIEFHLRRLESSARKSAGDGEWFEAQWMWYKLDDTHKWIRYEASLISAFEESYLEGKIQIDPNSLRRRPAIFMSQSEVQAIKKRTASEESAFQQPFSTEADVRNSNSDPPPQSSQSSLYSSPEPPSNQCYRVKVESGTQDYLTIDKLFRGSTGQVNVEINNLEKIHNEILWKQYISKKKEMTDQLLPGESVNERHLFMPCRHDDVERIMKNNVYVSRLVVPNQFGPGHYFTSNASLCFRWCTEDHTQSRFLLVCQVLLGTYTQGSPNTTARPRRHDSRFYDSLVDNITEPTVFVVADVDQCYPAFIVDFSYTPTATRDQGDTIGNFQTRDDNPPFVTRRREESLSSPTIPTYPYFPDSIGQATENHPVSNLDYASQHLPSTAGTASVSDPHRGVASDPTLAFNTHHLDDSVKAPPPYSERPVNSAVSVPSRPPPSYSESTQRPVSGYPRQPTTGYPLQHTSSYPQQPASGYPQQHASGYPQQHASGYPQQHASGYPQQHASGYPQQHASGYPHPTNSREVPVQATERRNQTATGKKDDCVVM